MGIGLTETLKWAGRVNLGCDFSFLFGFFFFLHGLEQIGGLDGVFYIVLIHNIIHAA